MRVVERKRRPVERRRPPADAQRHPWAPGGAGEPPVFIDRGLAHQLSDEAAGAAARTEEALSLLVGDRFLDPATGSPYPVAMARATGPLVAGAARVRFDTGGFEAVARALDDVPFDYLVVGWFHSHVGLGCRPSAIDLATHRRFFRAPHQFALILDPVQRQAAAYTLAGAALAPRPLLVFGPPGNRP